MGRAWTGQAQPLQPRGRGPAESCWGSEEKAACPDVGELLAWMGTWGTDLPRTPLRCPLPARRRMLGVRTVSLAGTLVWGPVGQEGRGGGTDPVRPPAPSPILLLTRGGPALSDATRPAGPGRRPAEPRWALASSATQRCWVGFPGPAHGSWFLQGAGCGYAGPPGGLARPSSWQDGPSSRRVRCGRRGHGGAGRCVHVWCWGVPVIP